MTELKTLPKKWCVRGINDTHPTKDVRIKTDWYKYFNNIDKSDLVFSNNFYYHVTCDLVYFTKYIPYDYTEISYDDFMKYIVNNQEIVNTNHKLIEVYIKKY